MGAHHLEMTHCGELFPAWLISRSFLSVEATVILGNHDYTFLDNIYPRITATREEKDLFDHLLHLPTIITALQYIFQYGVQFSFHHTPQDSSLSGHFKDAILILEYHN